MLIIALVAGTSIGPADVPFSAIFGTLAQHLPWHPAVFVSAINSAIIWQIRLPRVLLGALVGAMLAGGGAAYQGFSATRWPIPTCSASLPGPGSAPP